MSMIDTDFHLPFEQEVEASGREWTHVRPGEFSLNGLRLWGTSLRAERVVREPEPEAAWCPVHERDIADVATGALPGAGHTARAHALNGPEFVSRRGQVAAIAEATGEPVSLVVEPRVAGDHYLARDGSAAESADLLPGFEDYSGDDADPVGLEGFDPVATGHGPRAHVGGGHRAAGAHLPRAGARARGRLPVAPPLRGAAVRAQAVPRANSAPSQVRPRMIATRWASPV